MGTRIIGVLTFVLCVALWTVTAWADVWVQGYTRQDGTYVAPHYRSSPDNSYNNNWSTSPNINPYTGEQGTRAPTWDDRPPRQGNDFYGGDSYEDSFQGWGQR